MGFISQIHWPTVIATIVVLLIIGLVLGRRK